MDGHRRARSLARLEQDSKFTIAKKGSVTQETDTQNSPGRITIQQFDFKAHFNFFPHKRLSEKLPKSLVSPSLASFRTPLQQSLHSVRRKALTRIDTADLFTIKSRGELEKPAHWDFPKSAKIVQDLAIRKQILNIEKTTARGGGFTTFGHVYQFTPKRVPFLISKRESGLRKRRNKVMLSLEIPKRGLEAPRQTV